MPFMPTTTYNFVLLIFLAPPIFVDVGNRFMMKLIQLSHMEDTEIRCNAISAPNESEPVVILWMRNGRNINKGNYKILVYVYTYHCCKNIYFNVSGFYI